MQSKGKWLYLVMAMALVLPLVAGCAPGAPAPTAAPKTAAVGVVAPTELPPVAVPTPKGAYKVAILIPFVAIPFHNRIADAAAKEGKKYGVETIVLEAGGYGNVAKQVAQIEDVVARKVDAIILWAVSAEGTVKAVEEAVAKGVKVINTVTPTASEKVVSKIMSDDEKLGALYGEWLAKELGQKGKVAMVSGAAGAYWSETRHKGAKGALAKYPNIKIADEKWLKGLDAADALKATEDIITANPDVAGIYYSVAPMAIAGYKGLEEAKLAGKVKLVGGGPDTGEDIVALVDGRLDIMPTELAMIFGKWSMDYIIKVLNGEQAPPVIIVPNIVYTRDNLAQLKADLPLMFSDEEIREVKEKVPQFR
ncbi:MAG: sugar ABC transporter substrate-binding protein [Dehalococcoidia bacterium]|nr:sugar ABC transporter substrate-binding protein [Dehalococcoidia bacterium]